MIAKATAPSTVIDLASLTAAQGFVLSGNSSYASLGTSVSGIGDFNGDGIDDLLVSAPSAASGGLNRAGLSYVIFGKAGGMGNLSVSSLTAETGVVLSGAQSSGNFGLSVAGVGDVNGDGKADVIIGAPTVTFSGATSGGAYVVLGTGSAATIGANQLTGTAGFAISGSAANDAAGISVDGVGDINGDGYDDVVIGAYAASRGSRQYAGEAYVVYGSATPTSVNLATLDTAHGFTIKGAAYGDYAGFSVSGAGDINGDGHDDVIVGAPSATGGPGAAYVLYGGTNLANVDLSSLTAERGFKITGGAAGDAAGLSMDSAGDINGDGIDDLIVSAPQADANGTDSGALYIIYGQAGTRAGLNLANLTAAQGLRIAGAPGEMAGIVVRNVGDLDHDRIDDLFIGSNQADPNGRTDAGVGYVLYGGHVNGAVDLAALAPAQGFMVLGAAAGDSLGQSAAGAGDLNGDGIDDLVLGAAAADPGGVNGAGAAYVIYGHASGALVTKVDAQTADGTYTPGDVITLALTFESTVVVDTSGGTPRLKLETGATDHYATYVSGSGSDTLVFAYTVSEGDQTGDLDFAGTRALELNGGTLTGADGKAAILTLMDPGAAESLAANANIRVSPSAAPAITDLAGDTATFTEDGPAVALDAGGNAALATSLADFSGGKLVATISSGGVPAQDQLTLRPDAHVGLQGASVTVDGTAIGTISGGADGLPLQVTFTAGATTEQAQAVLRALAYSNTDTTAPDTGARTVAVTVTDPFGAASTAAAVSVSVNGQNDAPVLTPHTVFLSGVSENTPAPLSYADLQATGTASDPDGDTLAFKIMSIGSGTVLVDGVAAVAGDTVITAASKVTWTPQDNATGRVDAFSIAAFDGTAVSDEWATVRAVVADLDPDLVGPTAVSVPRGAAAGTIIATPTVAGDTNGLDFRILEVGVPTGAAASDGSVVLSPVDAGLAISASSGQVYVQDATKFAALAGSSLVVRIGVDDEDADTNLDDVLSISVSLKNPNANEPPTGKPTAILAAGTEGTPYLVSAAALLAGFSDPEGGALQVRDLRADHATLADNGDGTFTLTPEPNFNGVLSLTYAVADAAGNRLESQMQSVVISAENHPPVFSASPADVIVPEEVSIHPLAGLGVTDADGTVTTVTLAFAAGYVSGQDVLSFTRSSATGSITGTFSASTGTLTLKANTATAAQWQAALAAVTYANGYDTPDTSPKTLTLSASDGTASSAVHTFHLSVTDTPDTIIDLATLTSDKGFKIGGAVAGDTAGYSVSGAGDVNGDGIDDVIVAAPSGSLDGKIHNGATYLVYGKAGGQGDVDLAALTSGQGVKIGGAVSGDAAGFSVSGAGDVNGDGVDDIIVGAKQATANGLSEAGSAYVVYGKTGGVGDLDLANLTSDKGFKISGDAPYSETATSVSSAGDVNGDGIDDVIVGAPQASPYSRTYAGAAYVVYGKKGGLGDVDLATLTSDKGFKISGDTVFVDAGYSVSGTGDVNGDGVDDILVGTPYAALEGRLSAGITYVVYGKKGGVGDVDLASFTSGQGFKISGAATNDTAGYSVSSAGDVNGDGINDIIVGALYADPEGRSNAGSAYVVYGKAGGPGNVDLATLTSGQGFKIGGAAASDSAGFRVSGAGDVNGDGVDDLIVGAVFASPEGKRTAGSTYLVYGKKGGLGNLDLAALTSEQGFKVIGAAAGDYNGFSVSAAGDMNHDGFDDIVVGAPLSAANGKNGAGASYVVYGFSTGPHITAVGTTAEAGLYKAGEQITLTLTFDADVVVDTTGGTPKLKLETGTVDHVATYASGSGTKTLTFVYNIQPGDNTSALDVTGVDALSLDGATLTGTNGGEVKLTLPAPGTEGSLSAATHIVINEPPVLTLSSEAVTVAEGVSVALDAGLSVSDADDATLSFGRVSITDGYVIWEDKLSFAGTDATGDISGDFDTANGILTLTSASGTATMAQWQAAMAAVTYQNGSDAPSDAVRTVTFSVGDRFGSTSDAHKSLSVTPVNDAPVLYNTTSYWPGSEGQPVTLLLGDLVHTPRDPDGDPLQYRIVSIPAGSLTIDGVDARVGDLFTAASQLVWTPPANTTGSVQALQVAAFDGTVASTGTYTFSMYLTDVDPTLTGPVSVTLPENSPNGTVVARLAVTGDQDGLTFGFGGAKTVVDPDSVPVSSVVESNPNATTVLSPDGAFALDTRTGIVTVHDASKLDFETSPTFKLTVTVDDEDADTTPDSTTTLTVTLANVNEAPVISGTGTVLKISDFGRLSSHDMVKITGAAEDDWAGTSVSNAGDVNGDGIDDIIVGAPGADPHGQGSGAAYVVYGKKGGLGDINLGSLAPSEGFKISGANAADGAGMAVSTAGDLNGDGIADIVVGARNASSGAGAAYVLYGKAGGSTDIDLSTLATSDGFKISTAKAGSYLGRSVSAAGDINGDGIADIIVGANSATQYRSLSGAAYVIYGKKEGLGNLDLGSLTNADGFRIGGAATYDNVGAAVAGIGDVNGDGIDDLVVGALGSDLNGKDAGAAYVVYGKAGGHSDLDLANLSAADGVTILGAVVGDMVGFSAASAGDMNGDGINDFVVAGRKVNAGAGAAYVIYGKSGGLSNISLSNLSPADGFKIAGAATNDYLGYSVSNAGDINGDGLDDVVVGALNPMGNGPDSGAAYVIYGSKEQHGTINVATLLGSQGFQIDGPAGSNAGWSVSKAGDLNGDGIDDFVVGAANAGTTFAGAAYVIYGSKAGAPSAPYEGETVALTYNDLLKTAKLSDPDGDKVSFKVAALGSGTLTVDGVAAVAGETVITPSSVLAWTPAANTTGVVDAFSLAAFDGALTSLATVPVRITVADLNPTLTGPLSVTLPENSPNGTVVAHLAVTGDQDGLTFGFGSTGQAIVKTGATNGHAFASAGSAEVSDTATTVISPDGAFALDTRTGIITVHDASKLDFETSPTFKLTVTVDDEDADTTPDSTTTLTITLADVNEAPVISGLPATPVAATAGQAIALPGLTITDPDSTVFTVTLAAQNGTLAGLTDADADAVGLQLTGTASEIQAMLAAATFTPLVDGAAQVAVTVTDGGGAATSTVLAFQATTPAGTTVAVDGAIVVTTTQEQPNGGLQQTVKVEAMEAGAGGPEAADIPLVREADETLLSARLPAGVGLTATGAPAPQSAEASLLELIAQIRQHTPDGSADQTELSEGGKGFLTGLSGDTALLVQTLVLTATAGAGTDTPIVIHVPEGTAPTALVVDASALPAGTQIQFDNVAFAAVIGPVSLGGGAGAQVVYADDAPQTIMLGADDDELHAGGGNDTVGSAGGDDRIFGEAGDDIVFGGPGRDLLHGGLGTDTARFDGNVADYEILHDRAITVVRSRADATDVDVLVNVENIAFADGTVTLAQPENIGWIAALFATVLDRQADLSGIQYYAGLAERGVSVGDIALAFLTSPEAIAAGTGADAGTLTVEQLYRTLLGREPDAEGLAYHKAQLAAGATLAEVAAHFVLSPEMQGHLPAASALDFSVGAVTAGLVTGTAGADTLQGGTLDDTLISNGGADVIDGHTGNDTAVFSGNRADYTIAEKDVHWVVKPIIVPNLPNDGAILKNVEHIQFADMTIDLTPNSDLAWIGALYTQVLGRQGDEGGLMAHLADYQAGASKGSVALSFLLSPEAVAAGHGAPDTAHLTADTVYEALLGRAPTQADHTAYGNLETDLLGLANALMDSAEVRGHDLHPTAQDFFI